MKKKNIINSCFMRWDLFSPKLQLSVLLNYTFDFFSSFSRFSNQFFSQKWFRLKLYLKSCLKHYDNFINLPQQFFCYTLGIANRLADFQN